MSKYSYEQKLEVVMGVVEKGLSHKAAARLIGAAKSDAQKWVGLYREYGVEGLLKKSGTYDGQFKISVIEYMCANHMSVREAAVKFGIPGDSTLAGWKRIYYEEGREALFRDNRSRKKMTDMNKDAKPDKKNEEDLIAENQRLRMENTYLKKLSALVRERIQQENGEK